MPSAIIAIKCLASIECRIDNIKGEMKRITSLKSVVAPGLREITVVAENYKPLIFVVSVELNSRLTIPVTLEPLPSKVDIISDITADIYINGEKLKKTTPMFKVSLEQGFNEIMFKKSGYRSLIIDKYFAANTQVEVSVQLKQQVKKLDTSELIIYSDRPWKSLTLNEHPITINSGESIKVKPGKYTIYLTFDLATVSKQFEIETGERKVIKAEFRKEKLIDKNKFIAILAGHAWVGSENYDQYNPLKKIFLNEFWVQINETTVDEYTQCVDVNVCQAIKDRGRYCNWGKPDNKNYPINCITAQEVEIYAQWLSEKDDNNTYRLPTSEQWERVARTDQGNKFPWGEKLQQSTCNTCDKNCPYPLWKNQNNDDGWAKMSPVGYLTPCVTTEGVNDIIGNVAELTRSKGIAGYQIKGGSWGHGDVFLEPAYTKLWRSDEHDPRVGFRLIATSTGFTQSITLNVEKFKDSNIKSDKNPKYVYLRNGEEKLGNKIPAIKYDMDTIKGAGNDVIHSMVRDRTSGWYYVGATKNNNGKWLGWLIRVDRFGRIVWERRMSQYDGDSVLKDIVITANGDLLVVGFTRKNSKNNSGDGWIVKITPNGRRLWSKTYGNNNDEVLNSISIFNNSDILAVGRVSTGKIGGKDAYVLRLNEMGDIIWQRQYGNDYDDVAITAITLGDGFAFAGWQNVDKNGGQNAWIVKTDSWGNTIWKKKWIGAHEDIIFRLIKTMDGNIVAVGNSAISENGNRKGLVLVLDQKGNITASNTIKGHKDGRFYGVHQHSNGKIIVVGATSSKNRQGTDGWIVELNAKGNVSKQWDVSSGKSDKLFSVYEDSHGNILASGYTTNILGKGNNGWIVKINNGDQKIKDEVLDKNKNE